MNKIIVICFVFSLKMSSQNINFRELAVLPQNLTESSGIVTIKENEIWTLNDSGNLPQIYKIDTNGFILQTVSIANASNIDWEDITTDFQNYFYIGDFGNNLNNRTNLRIYRIPIPNDTTSILYADTISFNYSNQLNFPPNNNNLNFDAEAFVALNDSLFIFTKNRTIPFTSWCYVYGIPPAPGTYNAVLVDSFNTNKTNMYDGWITSAALNASKTKLALLSSQMVWKFNTNSTSRFFRNTPETLLLPTFSQKEAIAFKDSLTFYITDEKFAGIGGKLYEISVLESETTNLLNLTTPSFKLLNNSIKPPNNNTYRITVFNLEGRVLYNSQKHYGEFNVPNYADAILFIQIESENYSKTVFKVFSR